MKKYLVTVVLLTFFISGFAQNKKWKYEGRFSPAITKEKLSQAKYLNEIMPEFSHHVVMPSEERALLDQQLELKYYLNQYYVYPQEFFSPPVENYSKIIYFVSIEMTGMCNGKIQKAKGETNLLTGLQKNLLSNADPGTDINIKVRYKYKSQANIPSEELNKIKEGIYTLTAVPETEAEFPGGFKALTDHMNKNVFDLIPQGSASEKIKQAIVHFTITETGRAENPIIYKTSGDPSVDKILLNAINKMPSWKPAMDAKGKTIKQAYSIPLSEGGGC